VHKRINPLKCRNPSIFPCRTQFGIGLEGSGSHSPEPPSHPSGAHAVEVEIDPDTGEVSIERYVMVDDLGQVLNPMIVDGQQHGGVAQGIIGQALYEHAVYDRSTAQLVTGSFMAYAMPRADMLPKFEIALEEIRCKTNPIGVKGIGESGTIGAPPAIIDALGPLGIDRIDMPATPNRVWQAIQSAKGVA
jgi:aerobic carbon-monoxide dehydrogenase large subunit